MIYRVLAGVLLYAALPFAWAALGAVLLFAPARFAAFVDENVIALPERSQGFAVQTALRTAGAGLIAFAARYVLHAIDVFR